MQLWDLTNTVQPVYNGSWSTWKCALYEQLSCVYRFKLYSLHSMEKWNCPLLSVICHIQVPFKAGLTHSICHITDSKYLFLFFIIRIVLSYWQIYLITSMQLWDLTLLDHDTMPIHKLLCIAHVWSDIETYLVRFTKASWLPMHVMYIYNS
jgi:hypothetical protein